VSWRRKMWDVRNDQQVVMNILAKNWPQLSKNWRSVLTQSYVYEKGAYFAAGRESVADDGSGAVVRKMISRLFHSYQWSSSNTGVKKKHYQLTLHLDKKKTKISLDLLCNTTSSWSLGNHRIIYINYPTTLIIFRTSAYHSQTMQGQSAPKTLSVWMCLYVRIDVL